MRRFIFSYAAITLFLLMVRIAQAQDKVPIVNPLEPGGVTDVPSLVNKMVTAILGIVGALTLAMFVYGGVMWLTSLGNSQRIEKGKETLLWATVGLLVIFSSYAILTFIFSALSGTGQ